MAARKENSKKPHQPWINYLITLGRKRIEIAFSDITKSFSKTIHALTEKEFLIKLIAFILGYTLNKMDINYQLELIISKVTFHSVN